MCVCLGTSVHVCVYAQESQKSGSVLFLKRHPLCFRRWGSFIGAWGLLIGLAWMAREDPLSSTPVSVCKHMPPCLAFCGDARN